MANERKVSVHTPLGELTACVGFDEESFPEIFVYLVRPDGVEIDLVAADVDVETKYARAFLYGDTATCDWTKQHTWSEGEINVCDE